MTTYQIYAIMLQKQLKFCFVRLNKSVT